MAYAHSRGVIHRDLKPDNIMVGSFGEVRVLDWGLGLRAHAEEPASAASAPEPRLTQDGTVAGSPGYMAPEQALGRRHALGPSADVYALGAVLYQILSGAPPHDSRPPAGPRPVVTPLASRARLPVAAELIAIVERAMAEDANDRYPDAGALAEDIGAWLEGARREDKARALIRRGDAIRPQIEALRRAAEDARSEAKRGLSALARHASSQEKAAFWALEDEAAELEREAALAEVERGQLTQAALAEAPDLEEAHQRLADQHHEEAIIAEKRRDLSAMIRLEALIRVHDRGPHQAWLRGDGRLDLQTDPPGAEVWWRPLQLVDRRLTPGEATLLGHTPLSGVTLPQGSHLLMLRAPGRAELRYPVLMPRGGVWSPVRPDEGRPHTLRLPLLDEVGPQDVVVPAGPCWLGDPDLQAGLPRTAVWVDSFILRRDPVTNREFLAWLNALVEQGRGEEAARHAPASSPTHTGGVSTAMYGRDGAGRFFLTPDPEGDLWDPDWPVVLVDWSAAMAFADWTRQQTGQPWRLPWEAEREKALRGVDGRSLPWGDHVEPTWTRNAQSSADKPTPSVVGLPVEDESVYGVRGLAGNVRDWSLSLRTATWEHLTPQGLFAPPPVSEAARWEGWRLNLGGAWSSGPGFARAGYRLGAPIEHRNALIGFRLARTLH